MGIKIKKKKRGVEALKSRYGRLFVLPWEIGLILFFVMPIINSIRYAFSDVRIVSGGVDTKFVGFKWFDYIINQDPDYLNRLKDAVGVFLVQLPIILALSLILAIVLNQKFKGRIVMRAIYFLPVIIATGVIIDYLSKSGMIIGATSGETAGTYGNMINFDKILENLGLPDELNELIAGYISGIFNLLWNCGIQIILFISGLQSIPDSLYEVAKVEGCSKWEEFWYITFPMLGQNILLVMVYTMIDLITTRKYIMSMAFELMSGQQVYDKSSAMLWLYFLIIGVFMAIILAVYNKLCLKRWS
ncbi:MAG: sugar ABC transporter permease [Clostridia bacterium]|nr:sugar ABC transporter permease [Clostridia bacterium]